MPSRQDLPSKLVKARQQLQKAQSRVAELEVQIFGGQPSLADLAGSEDHYRPKLDNLLEGCQLIGFDWRYLYVNDAAARHAQRTKHELLGYSMLEKYPGIEQTPMFAALQRCMQERSIARIENEVTYLDGASAWFELNIQPVPAGIFILSLDITERKKTEEALRLLEEMFSSAFHTGPAGLTITRIADGKFIDANQPFCEMFEFSREEVIGHTSIELKMWTSEERQKLIQQQRETGGLHNFELTARSKSGRPIHVLFSSKEVRLHGDSCHITTMIDITVRKKAEDGERNQRILAEALRNSLVALTTLHDVEAVMQQILIESASVIPCEAGTIILYEEQMGRVAYSRGFSSEAEDYFKHNPVSLAGGLFPTGYGGDDHYLAADTSAEPRWISYPVTTWIRSSIGVSIILHGRPIGLLIADSATPNRFQEKDIDNFRVFARYAALALESAEVVDQLELKVIERTAELQSAKQRVEAILNSSPDAILLTNSDLSIQQANVSFNTLFGSEPDAYLGKSLRSLFHPDDASRLSDFPQLDPNQPNGKHIEIGAIRTDGTTFDVELSSGLIEDSGLVCVIRDITERKAQERQLRYHAALQENITDAVIVLDTNYRIQSWNRAAEHIYGWQADEVIGKSIDEVLRSQVSSPDERALILNKLNEQGSWQGEAIQYHRNGSILHVLVSSTLLKNENGTPYGSVNVNHDITEHKAQERQLQYHASLQENVSDAVIVTDMNFVIQSWNKAAERIYGWTAKEAIGKASTGILRSEILPQERERSIQDLREQGWWHGEVIQHHKDGRSILVWGSITLIKDEHGIPSSVVAVNHDITERKQAEETLRKSAEEIQDLYNNAPCGYHSLDKHGLIVQINDTELKWLGYTHDEVVGRLKITDIFTPESVAAFRKEFPAFTERGWVNDLEFDVVRKDSTIMHIILNAVAVYDEAGQYLKSRSTLFDITELRQAQQNIVKSEARYRLLAENIGDIIMTFSLDRIITYMSPSCERLLGYLSEEVEGKSHSEFIHPEDYPQVTAKTRQAVKSKENFYTNQFRLRHKAGHYIWYEVGTRIIYDHNTDNVVQFISVLRDITERKRADDALRASEERLRTIVENIPVMISFFDVEGHFEFVNRCWLDQVGWTVADLTTAEDPLVLFYPDPEYRQQVLGYMLSAEPGWRDFHSQTKHHGERITSWANVRLSDGRGIGIGQDITERKQAEIALRESEERFRRAIIDAPFPMMIHAEDGEILQISKRWAELSGYDLSEIPRMEDWLERAYGDRRLEIKPLIDRVYSYTEPIHGGEFKIQTKSGRSLIWDFVSAPIGHMPDGRRLVSSMAMDVTERKQIEEALQLSETKFRQLIDAAPIAIVVTNQTGDIEIVNAQAEMVFGYERNELIGQKVEILVPEALKNRHSNYHSDPTLLSQRLMASTMDLFARRKDASVFPAEIQLSSVQTSDSFLMMSFVLDVTERKRMIAALERQRVFLREVIDASPSMIFVKDIEGRFIFANPAMAIMFNTTVDELLAKFDHDLSIREHEIAGFHEIDRRVITRGETVSVEESVTLSTGDVRWIQTTKVPLFSEDGLSIHALGISTDITERKKAEIALQQALAKEKELGDLKTRFVSMASHEFRTPLATILAVTETLSAYRHKLSDEQIAGRLDKIKDQISHLKDIMEDVLMLARMQARRVEFNPVKLDLDALSRSVIDEIQSQADVKNRLEYAAGEGSYEAMLDRKLMRQVISNLVSNAIKYSPEDKVVRIRLEYADAEVILKISDEGIGIPEADLPHLFEPFHRAANVGTISGTGLGLVITHEAVDLHGGTITVESQQGVGTTFIVRIPIAAGGEQKNNENTGH